MSSSDISHDQLSDGYTDMSPLKQCAKVATYNFYKSKYENFVNFISELALKYGDARRWAGELQSTSFDMFCYMGIDHLKGCDDIDEIIQDFCLSSDFDITILSDCELDKLKRYLNLFKNM
jgi:hypothetical protein